MDITLGGEFCYGKNENGSGEAWRRENRRGAPCRTTAALCRDESGRQLQKTNKSGLRAAFCFVAAIEERSFVAALLRMTANGGRRGGEKCRRSRDGCLARGPVKGGGTLRHLRVKRRGTPRYTAATKPPALLRNEGWGTLPSDLWVWQEDAIAVGL
jgi:hypothetical protein